MGYNHRLNPHQDFKEYRRFMAKKSQNPPRKGSKKVTPKKKNTRTFFWIAIGAGLILIAVLIGIGLYNSRSSDTGNTTAEKPADRTAIGDVNAPVLVETYEDFICPHCADFTEELGPVIMELVNDGTVRWDYKYRVIGGADSLTANMAAECAADQGKFWEYHEELFRRIKQNGKIAVFPDSLKKQAADMGLNTREFNDCLDSKKHLDEIKQIDKEAAARGVTGTPTIFINGQIYDGSRSPEAFRAAIEAAAGQ
jgi:protein-disulfide isomerase